MLLQQFFSFIRMKAINRNHKVTERRHIIVSQVTLICGKICSGKSYYAKKIQSEKNAVILSTDEVTYDLIRNEQGDFYNVFAARVNLYLRKKSVEIIHAGAAVILDWGFWTAAERQEITAFYTARGISVEWAYIDIDNEDWMKNIRERNERVLSGNGGSDFFVDDGLLEKVNGLFEVPSRDEIDRWIKVKR